MAKHELTTLAEALAILLELRDANKAQTEGTEKAVSQLGRFLGQAKFPRPDQAELVPGSPTTPTATCSASSKGCWPSSTAR